VVDKAVLSSSLVDQGAVPSALYTQDEQSWLRSRRTPRPYDEYLRGDTVRLFFGLPRGIRPIHLPKVFPRIANEMPGHWVDTAAIHAYLTELLEDGRGGRQGFPPLVAEELRTLQRYIVQRMRHEDGSEEAEAPHGRAKRRYDESA
jgi:hypothetical protein